MNPLSYYTRKNDAWTEQEILDIKLYYDINEMTISKIGDIQRRTPGSIGYKLKHMGIITNVTDARGYQEYRNSNLYKEIVDTPKPDKPAKKNVFNKQDIINTMLLNEITELKIIVRELSDKIHHSLT